MYYSRPAGSLERTVFARHQVKAVSLRPSVLTSSKMQTESGIIPCLFRLHYRSAERV